MGRTNRTTGWRGASSLTMVHIIVAWAVLMPALLMPTASSTGPPDPEVTFTEQLVFSTFLGNSAEEGAQAIVCDPAGNSYITGYTRSSSFPTTAGAYDTTLSGSSDIFVAKLAANGSSLLWSTFVGGSGFEWGYDIALDSAGNVVVAGTSTSTDFPTLVDSYDRTHNGNSDIVVFKLKADGSRLLSSTYLGGSSFERAQLYLDASDDIYLTGYSYSSNYPTTPNAYDRTFDGSHLDIVVTKLEADCSAVVYSTYVGGSSSDYCFSRAVVDSGGNLWAAGQSDSTDFPTTTGCYDSSKDLQYDSVVFRLNETGGNLTASTFIGGSYSDDARSIALNPDGDLVVLGRSSSSDYPVTTGVFDGTHSGSGDAVVSVLDKDLTKLLRSTFLGGSGDEYSDCLHLDMHGELYVAGYTSSTDFPMKPDHYDDSHNGYEDIFIAKLSSDLTTLHNSTYIGGIGGERAYMMDLGPGNLIYLAGYSLSPGFPVTTGSFDTSHNGNSDAIALKFSFPGAPDRDNDGVPDEKDAFPDNPYEYRDTDGDGIGDNLDLDADGDGVGDFRDAFPLDPKETIDTDNDGTGDNADADDDNDGVNDTKDKFPLNPFEFADTDEDGIGNNLDPDDDNDGTTDVEEVRNVIRKGLSTVEGLAASVQAQLDADLAGLNGSLHASLDTLGSDFLGELRGLNATLADDIAGTLQSITSRASSVAGGAQTDLDDLHAWLDQVLSALGSKITATNSTLQAAMDDMDSRTEDLQGALTDDLFLLTVRLERIGSDLGEEDDAIRADIDALSKTVADLDGHTLRELEELIDRLATNVSRYDLDTAEDLTDLAAEIAAFEEAMEGNMAALNTTMADLDKLTAILADLEALDASMADAQEEIDRSVEDAGADQASKGGTNTMLIVIIIVLVVLIVVLLLRTPASPGPSTIAPAREEDIIISADEGEPGGDDR